MYQLSTLLNTHIHLCYESAGIEEMRDAVDSLIWSARMSYVKKDANMVYIKIE